MDKKQELKNLEEQLAATFAMLKPADVAPSRDQVMFAAGQVAAKNRIFRLKTACSLLAACLAISVAGVMVCLREEGRDPSASGGAAAPVAATTSADVDDRPAARTKAAQDEYPASGTAGLAGVNAMTTGNPDDPGSGANLGEFMARRESMINDLYDVKGHSCDEGMNIRKFVHLLGSLTEQLGDSASPPTNSGDADK